MRIARQLNPVVQLEASGNVSLDTVAAIAATLWLQYGVKAHWIYFFPFSFGVALLVGYAASLVLPGRPVDERYTMWGRARLGQAEAKREDGGTI